MTHPTAIPDLNAVLDVLRRGVETRLGTNLVGLYLQGSFAVGDADANSDCDFIVAIRRDLTEAEIAGLDALHAEIHRLPILPWRHRLEGSYVPIGVLRRWSLEPRDPPGASPRPQDWADPGLSGSRPNVYPFVYLDHGAKTLLRSEHDNTQVVRWCLREKGVVLTGPDPRDLVDPVSPDALRAEVRVVMARAHATGLQPIDTLYWQAFWVGLYCRMLHTIMTGAVASKRASCGWAAETLGPEWRGLIHRTVVIRDGDRERAMVPLSSREVDETVAFAGYVMTMADRF